MGRRDDFRQLAAAHCPSTETRALAPAAPSTQATKFYFCRLNDTSLMRCFPDTYFVYGKSLEGRTTLQMSVLHGRRTLAQSGARCGNSWLRARRSAFRSWPRGEPVLSAGRREAQAPQPITGQTSAAARAAGRFSVMNHFREQSGGKTTPWRTNNTQQPSES